MKRYALFCFDQYYPGGGWCDFRGSFDSITEALAAGTHDYQKVVDLQTGEMVIDQ